MSKPSGSESRELPAWFYRVTALTLYPGDVMRPHYFDEDLSDLEEDRSDEDSECKCGDEWNCDCDDNENTSERSYNGDVADWYYELKELREERKLVLFNRNEKPSAEEIEKHKKMAEDEKKMVEVAKKRARENEALKEAEVLAAYAEMKRAEDEGETLAMDSLINKEFRLFSTDHLHHYIDWESDEWDASLSKYIQFYNPQDPDYTGDTEQKAPKGFDRWTVEGFLCIDGHVASTSAPFRSPSRPSQEMHVMKCFDWKYVLAFQFISDKYLRLLVSRELVFDTDNMPESVPEAFEFMGIYRDFKAEREE